MEDRKFSLKRGNPNTLGVTREGEEYNFAVAVPDGREVSLLIYEKGGSEPVQEMALSSRYRTGSVYAAYVTGFDPKCHEYNYRFGDQVLQDPCASALRGMGDFGELPDPQMVHKVRCSYLSSGQYDWEDDRLPMIPYEDSVIYKVHVRGYTMHKNSKVKKKGTFAGLKEKIPYFRELGVTALEVMPAYEFQELIAPEEMPPEYVFKIKNRLPLNFWGYTKGYYFAPKAAYSHGPDPSEEFRELVKELHKAQMECIMEFYFPPGYNPQMVQSVLRHWKIQYHVDGFHLIGDVPENLLANDPVLARTKLIFQVADCGGNNGNLAEYNEGFKQDMRRWLKGDEDSLGAAIYRMRRNPDYCAVINYMANQDGFTLLDMVSYDKKHNEANNEGNQDGSLYNYSWNCGVEGPTRKKSIRILRARQMKNAFLMVMLSQGTPLIYGGDEFGNSQQGNNNAYCQDNEIGWVDWSKARLNQEMTDFVRESIAFRKSHPVLHMRRGPKGIDYRSVGYPDISYHGNRAWYGDMEPGNRQIGIMYCEGYGKEEAADSTDPGFLYLAFNMHWEIQELALPHLPEQMEWRVVMKTCGEEWEELAWIPQDEAEAPPAPEQLKFLPVPARTILVLEAREKAGPPKEGAKVRLKSRKMPEEVKGGEKDAPLETL